MDLEDRIRKSEDKRIKALHSGNASKYARYCVKLGIEDLENRDLYDRGIIELKSKGEKSKTKAARIDDILEEGHHRQFLREAKPLTQINKFAEPEKRKELLISYYPGQFGHDGRQPIESKNTLQVGRIFEKVYKTYSEKYK